MDTNAIMTSKRENVDDISAEDVEESLRILKEVPNLCSSVLDTVKSISTKLHQDELPTTKGISFLDLKNYNLLNYVTNLTYLIVQKFNGQQIENSRVVERLAELRIVLEKMRPIHEKLKYQINKLQSAATVGNIDTSNPLRFRANPENLEAEDGNDEEEKGESNVYVPPKISAAYFEEDETLEARRKKILERSQKKALSSSVLYELRKEYDTGPEEIRDSIDPYRSKISEEMKDRTRYEEEYMTRLPMTKKQRHEARQLTTVTNFNAKFEDFSALDMNPEDVSLKRRSSGRNRKFSKKSGKFKGKKRR